MVLVLRQIDILSIRTVMYPTRRAIVRQIPAFRTVLYFWTVSVMFHVEQCPARGARAGCGRVGMCGRVRAGGCVGGCGWVGTGARALPYLWEPLSRMRTKFGPGGYGSCLAPACHARSAALSSSQSRITTRASFIHVAKAPTVRLVGVSGIGQGRSSSAGATGALRGL